MTRNAGVHGRSAGRVVVGCGEADPDRGGPALSRGLMRMVLGRLGYVVSCVADGREAAVSLAHTDFALVMVALRLADGAGPAFARRLRQRAGAGPPRLLLFGDAWDGEAVVQECRAAGIDGYLPKPVTIAKHVAAVRELTRPTYDPRAAANDGATAMADHHLPAPIDQARLASFTDGDDQLERELGSLYVATAGRYLAEMRAALTAGAPWDYAAHSLKGASANLGVTEVATLAAVAEKAPPGAEPLARLDEAFARAQRWFEERCSGGAVAARLLERAG